MAEDAEDEPPRIVGKFTDYNELIKALRLRAAELNLSGEQCDSLSGLPARYAQKLLGPQQIAVRGVLVEDKAAVEKLMRQTTPRQSQYVRTGAVHIELSMRHMRKIAAQGGRNSRKYLGKRLVKQLARKAAAARWQKSP